jgi:hypothetical protein
MTRQHAIVHRRDSHLKQRKASEAPQLRHLLKQSTLNIFVKMSDQAGRRAVSYGLESEDNQGGVSEHHTEGLLESAEDAHRHRYAYNILKTLV